MAVHDNSGGLATARRPNLRPELRPVAALTGVVLVMAVTTVLEQQGTLTSAAGAGAAVVMMCAVAGLGARAAHGAAARSAGLARRGWRLRAYGLRSWARGVGPYLL